MFAATSGPNSVFLGLGLEFFSGRFLYYGAKAVKQAICMSAVSSPLLAYASIPQQSAYRNGNLHSSKLLLEICVTRLNLGFEGFRKESSKRELHFYQLKE